MSVRMEATESEMLQQRAANVVLHAHVSETSLSGRQPVVWGSQTCSTERRGKSRRCRKAQRATVGSGR